MNWPSYRKTLLYQFFLVNFPIQLLISYFYLEQIVFIIIEKVITAAMTIECYILLHVLKIVLLSYFINIRLIFNIDLNCTLEH